MEYRLFLVTLVGPVSLHYHKADNSGIVPTPQGSGFLAQGALPLSWGIPGPSISDISLDL